MLRFVLICCLTLLSAASWAQGPLVVSTHPLYLIAQKITAGVEEPQLLLSNQSGHDVQLTPAHRKAIQDASLVIWLGKAHEAPLAKLLDNNAKAVSIINSQIGTSLPQRTTRGVPIANTIDTHVWLDPNNAVRIGFFIAALRSQQMPENKTKYWNNARLFARDMLQVAQKYNSTAAPKPYWSYHDAYQYLERSLNLKFAGALTDDPHVAPTVGQIKYLNDNRPSERMCLMAEAHASKNQYQKLSPIVFESVDESLTGENDFVVAWQKLASQTVKCVQTASK